MIIESNDNNWCGYKAFARLLELCVLAISRLQRRARGISFVNNGHGLYSIDLAPFFNYLLLLLEFQLVSTAVLIELFISTHPAALLSTGNPLYQTFFALCGAYS